MPLIRALAQCEFDMCYKRRMFVLKNKKLQKKGKKMMQKNRTKYSVKNDVYLHNAMIVALIN